MGEPEEREIPLGDIAEGFCDDIWELVREDVEPPPAPLRDTLKAGELNDEPEHEQASIQGMFDSGRI